jgi:hypothetical protein
MYYAQLQAVRSVTSQSGDTRSAPMWEAVVDRTGRGWGFHYNLLGIGPDFQTDNGFVPRTGFVQPNVSNRFTLFGRPGALLERYQVFATTTGIWRYADFFAGRSLLEGRASASHTLTFRRGWSVTVSPVLASYAFDPASYAGVRAGPATAFAPSDRVGVATSGFSVATPQFRRFFASAGGAAGNDVDFQETSRVRRRDWNATLDLRPSERVRVSATYASTRFTRRRDGERIVETRIPRLRAEYQLARPLFVRVVSQYESSRRAALRDPRTGALLLVPGTAGGGFVPSAARASNALRTDWLVSYRPRPGTVLFAGYGNTLTEARPLAFDGLRRTADAFFVKASYVFRLARGD